jgi:hypothetical protein
MRVSGFGGLCVGALGVLMGLCRVLVGFGRVFMGFLVIALAVVLGCQAMMLGRLFVMLRGFVVCFVCHWIVLWEISRRDPTRRLVKSSPSATKDSHQWQEIHELATFPYSRAKKCLPAAWEVISQR